VHSAKYPFLKKHNWFVMFTDAKTRENIIFMEKIAAREGNVAEFKMQQRFGQAGKFNFHVFFMCDSYIGFDKDMEVTFEILPEDKSRVIEPVSQEDIAAVKGPGMVQSMLDIKAEDEDDGESSDDGTENLIAKLEKAGLKNATDKSRATNRKTPPAEEKKSNGVTVSEVKDEDNQLLLK
jgi:hypothetical protein